MSQSIGRLPSTQSARRFRFDSAALFRLCGRILLCEGLFEERDPTLEEFLVARWESALQAAANRLDTLSALDHRPMRAVNDHIPRSQSHDQPLPPFLRRTAIPTILGAMQNESCRMPAARLCTKLRALPTTGCHGPRRRFDEHYIDVTSKKNPLVSSQIEASSGGIRSRIRW